MLQGFEAWSAKRSEINTFSELQGTTIGIEASNYLHRLLNEPPTKEPLLSALGGLPFALKAHIENDLENLQNNDIKPLFIFNGLKFGKTFEPFKASDQAAKQNTDAWRMYHNHEAVKAVETFGNSGFGKAEDYYRLLQSILHARNLEFQIAPYSAWAQLAYLAKQSNMFVDAIVGSSELLMFDVDRVIINLDFERHQFTWITRQACIEELGLASTEMFVDACLLSGSALLPTLPKLLTTVQPRQDIIRGAVELMKSHGSTGISVCTQFADDPAIQNADYLDRYRRMRLAIKHHVILTYTGNVEPLTQMRVPNDFHEIMSQRLPEELYFYLARGITGPRVLNQLTSQRIYETAPADGGESNDYQTLVRDKLTPLRTSALALLAYSLTRAYQHRGVKLICWFDAGAETTIDLIDYSPPGPVIDRWNVREDLLKKQQGYSADRTTLSFTISALADPKFAAQTISPKNPQKLLSTQSEFEFNSLGRFCHFRGYVNDKHELSDWGKVLAKMMRTGPQSTEFDEVSILATELLRVDLLNASNMFPTYTGHPFRGSETDKRNCLLVSRVACLGKLNHQSIGFTGPLSRHLLAYTSMINAVQTCNRDLLEMCLTTMLLRGDANRFSPETVKAVSLSLPFLLPLDCSLGIAMKQYLDELSAYSDRSDTIKEDILSRGPKEWFPFSSAFKEDLQKAFSIWDKVYAGVKLAAELGLVKDKELWDGVNTWLTSRR